MRDFRQSGKFWEFAIFRAWIETEITFWRGIYGTDLLYTIHKSKTEIRWKSSYYRRGSWTDLFRLAYPKCFIKMRDKIACAQFITTSNSFIKRTFQLKSLTSLRAAIERAMTIKISQKNSFLRKLDNFERKSRFSSKRKRKVEARNWGEKRKFKWGKI